MGSIIYYLPIFNKGEGKNEKNVDDSYDGDAHIGYGTVSTAFCIC